jgi:GT2 family glycosyltransferase
MSKPVLSIVAGTYNRRDQLQRLVESVASETSVPYILYITDAGSTDGTVEYLKSVASDRVKPIFVGKLLGQARSYNDVFMMVDTPYVCWVSDDNVIVNKGLDVGVSILQKNRRVGMVGLKVKDQEGPFTKAPYIGGVSTIGILNVNQGMLPTAVMQAVGGFSEGFRDYGIDPDLTAKVLFLGFDIVYTRQVAIHHYRNWSQDKSSPEYKALATKQERGKQRYEALYAQFNGPKPRIQFKKQVWEFARAKLSKRVELSMNSPKPILGNLPRDYYNTVAAKYVGMLDPFVTLGKPFHLRQRFRGRWKLVSDGDLPAVEAGAPPASLAPASRGPMSPKAA